MTNRERAKQFLPFDAMKGLTEELRRREEKHLRVERAVLSETQQEEINATLIELKKGDKVAVTYYRNGHYVTETLTYRKNVPTDRILSFEEINIPFELVAKIVPVLA